MERTVTHSFFLRSLLLVAAWMPFCSVLAECDLISHPAIDGRPGQPAIAGNVAYVGSSTGTLAAIDLGTGNILWQANADGPVFHAPAVTEALVLYGSQDGKLRAVDRATGELRWSFAAGDVDWEVRDIFINGTPNIVDGVAYFSSEDWNVYAVDVGTGEEVWRHTLGEEPQAWHLPIVGRVAYIGAWDGHLYAIDIDSGERAWVSQTDDRKRADLPAQVPFVTAVPIVDDDSVYFPDWAGNLFAVDRATGKQRWRYDANAIDGRHVGSRSFIAAHGDVIYFSTVEDRHLVGVDRDSGREVWRQRTDGVAYGPGEVAEGIGMYLELLAAEGDGPPSMIMRILDLGSRRVRWSADDVAGPPGASTGTLYYVATDGKLRARLIEDGSTAYPGC